MSKLLQILFRLLWHGLIFFILTIVTQIGGVIYLLNLLIFRSRSGTFLKRFALRLMGFIVLYGIANQIIVPNVAKMFGREKIVRTDKIEPVSFLTDLCNRNYVRPELNTVLQNTATALDQKYKGIKVAYLDANFPFIDGFDLLPHTSHKDGKKLDLAFIYKDQTGKLVNDKPARSGYGIFVEPKKNEENRTEHCKKSNDYYDYPKYFTFGTQNASLQFSEEATAYMVKMLLKNQSLGRFFFEPHLVKRLGLQDSRFGFQGCASVRHDDHIHIQLK